MEVAISDRASPSCKVCRGKNHCKILVFLPLRNTSNNLSLLMQTTTKLKKKEHVPAAIGGHGRFKNSFTFLGAHETERQRQENLDEPAVRGGTGKERKEPIDLFSR